MMQMMQDDEIGGAVVRRNINMGGRQLHNGDRLTREEVLAINRPNLKSMVDNRFLVLQMRGPGSGDRFAVHQGRGRYDVIEGRRLNAEPMDKDAAEAMVAEGVPAKH